MIIVYLWENTNLTNLKLIKMKTTNLHINKMVKSGVLIIMLALVPYFGFAGDSKESKKSKRSTISVRVKNYIKSFKKDVATFDFLQHEKRNEVENWMVSDSYWVTETVANEIIPIETWMFDNMYWNQAEETPLTVSAWMVDLDYFSDLNEKEQVLEVENWMVSSEYWSNTTEPELTVENWMVDSNYFGK